jgi:hypothetical protein
MTPHFPDLRVNTRMALFLVSGVLVLGLPVYGIAQGALELANGAPLISFETVSVTTTERRMTGALSVLLKIIPVWLVAAILFAVTHPRMPRL